MVSGGNWSKLLLKIPRYFAILGNNARGRVIAIKKYVNIQFQNPSVKRNNIDMFLKINPLFVLRTAV